MRVSELIEKLQQMDPDAVVSRHVWYDPEYGDVCSPCNDVTCESVGWCDDMKKTIYEVFIE